MSCDCEEFLKCARSLRIPEESKYKNSAAGLHKEQHRMISILTTMFFSFLFTAQKNKQMSKDNLKVREIPHVEVVLLLVFAPAVNRSPEFSLTSLLLIICPNFKDHT